MPNFLSPVLLPLSCPICIQWAEPPSNLRYEINMIIHVIAFQGFKRSKPFLGSCPQIPLELSPLGSQILPGLS